MSISKEEAQAGVPIVWASRGPSGRFRRVEAIIVEGKGYPFCRVKCTYDTEGVIAVGHEFGSTLSSSYWSIDGSKLGEPEYGVIGVHHNERCVRDDHRR